MTRSAADRLFTELVDTQRRLASERRRRSNIIAKTTGATYYAWLLVGNLEMACQHMDGRKRQSIDEAMAEAKAWATKYGAPWPPRETT